MKMWEMLKQSRIEERINALEFNPLDFAEAYQSVEKQITPILVETIKILKSCGVEKPIKFLIDSFEEKFDKSEYTLCLEVGYNVLQSISEMVLQYNNVDTDKVTKFKLKNKLKGIGLL